MKRKTGKERLQYLYGGDEPKKPIGKREVFTSQAEIDAANKQAKEFAIRKGLVSGEDTYVARNVGDVKPFFINEAGPMPKGKKSYHVPSGITRSDIQTYEGSAWYNDPHTGDIVELDLSVLNQPRFRNTPEQQLADKEALALRQQQVAAVGKPKFNTGTGTEGVSGATSNSQGWMALAQQVPMIANSLIDIFENDPRAYSKQPLVNASAMRGMVSPYNNFALGGELNDMDISEDQLAQLQQLADEQGITIEELIQQLQEASVEGQEGEEEIMQDEEVEDEEELFAYGGRAKRKIPIEVEGKEVIQTPKGTVAKVKGPKHEDGGVDIDVPAGTKIYSNRIKIDGKTMQDRKLKREKGLARLHKLAEKNPTDKLLKATLDRTTQTSEAEEKSDMAIQKIARIMYGDTETAAYGGVARKKYQLGADPVDPYFDKRGYRINLADLLNNLDIGSNTLENPLPPIGTPNVNDIGDRVSLGANINLPQGRTNSIEQQQPVMPGRLSAGDYIGLAGNAFNAIAPILNTVNNAAGNKPNVNRFLGFGRKAISANDQAQGYIAGQQSNALTDIESSAGAARNRNRNSASSVNTLRALDTVTDINTNRARSGVRDNFSRNMINLLGQRGQLENIKDRMEMSGEAARDMEDKADRDNYYSNMAENLVNFGTNVQGIGRSLNVAKSNRVDARLLSQLSRYGLEIDDDGNIVSIAG